MKLDSRDYRERFADLDFFESTVGKRRKSPVKGAMISTVIPAYMANETLERAARSVFMQKYESKEVIIVDDCSADSTYQIACKLAATARIPVRVIRRARNGGACRARNDGIRAARGEWIQFLDADDWLLQGKFQRSMKVVTEETDIVVTRYEVRRPSTEGIKTVERIPACDLEKMRIATFATNQLWPGCALYRKQLIAHSGGWLDDLGSGQEWEFSSRALMWARGLACVPEVLIQSERGRTGSISMRSRAQQASSHLLARIQLAKLIGALPLDVRLKANSVYAESLLNAATLFRRAGVEEIPGRMAHIALKHEKRRVRWIAMRLYWSLERWLPANLVRFIVRLRRVKGAQDGALRNGQTPVRS